MFSRIYESNASKEGRELPLKRKSEEGLCFVEEELKMKDTDQNLTEKEGCLLLKVEERRLELEREGERMNLVDDLNVEVGRKKVLKNENSTMKEKKGILGAKVRRLELTVEIENKNLFEKKKLELDERRVVLKKKEVRDPRRGEEDPGGDENSFEKKLLVQNEAEIHTEKLKEERKFINIMERKKKNSEKKTENIRKKKSLRRNLELSQLISILFVTQP